MLIAFLFQQKLLHHKKIHQRKGKIKPKVTFASIFVPFLKSCCALVTPFATNIAAFSCIRGNYGLEAFAEFKLHKVTLVICVPPSHPYRPCSLHFIIPIHQEMQLHNASRK